MIEKMPNHYSFTTPVSAHDEEALTALELAGRQGAKINEVIDDQNKLRTETENHLSEQDKNISDRMDEQDNNIEQHKTVVIPETVENEVNKRIQNGEFDTSINAYAGELIERVDNLVGSMEEGSTSLDAEVIDMRVGIHGTHESAGNSLRAEISNVIQETERVITPARTSFFKTGSNLFDKNDPECIIGGYYNVSNVFTTNADYNMTGFIRVEGGKPYTMNLITGLVVWYDLNRAFIGSTDSQTFKNDGKAVAPSQACYMRIAMNTTSWNDATIVQSDTQPEITPYSSIISDEYIPQKKVSAYDTTFIVNNSVNLFDSNDADVIIGGYVNAQGEYIEDTNRNQTGLIPVTSGVTYTASDKAGFVLWYDSTKTFLSSTVSNVFNTNGYVVTPENACYGRFLSRTNYWSEFMVVEGDTLPETYTPSQYKMVKAYIPNVDTGDLSGMTLTTYGDSIVFRNGWQPAIVEKFGFNHVNLGIGSTSMALHSEVESTYPCMVNAGRIQGVKDSNPDLLVIMAGTNDCHYGVAIGDNSQFSLGLDSKDKTTFKGAYSYLIETLLTWKPTLRMLLMTPMHSSYETGDRDYNTYSQAVREVAEYYCIPVADTSKESGISKFNYNTYTSDGIHPNDTGCEIISSIVGSKIRDMFYMRKGGKVKIPPAKRFIEGLGFDYEQFPHVVIGFKNTGSEYNVGAWIMSSPAIGQSSTLVDVYGNFYRTKGTISIPLTTDLTDVDSVIDLLLTTMTSANFEFKGNSGSFGVRFSQPAYSSFDYSFRDSNTTLIE